LRLTGLVYRAHHPRWAFSPLSGDGAARHGGRFNPTGVPALYTSRRMQTAWLEAQQAFPFKAQPLTLSAYDVDCADAADLTDPAGRAAFGATAEALACPWEALADRRETPPSWDLAQRLRARGIAAIIVPSFAAGATADDVNVVFWRWGPAPPHRLAVIDDEHRLPRDQSAWPARSSLREP
jgi:RES domain-containing protein